MGRLRIEVVAGAVQIHRQEEDGVVAVLIAVGLRVHEQHLLRQPVRRVGFLGVTVPEMLLLERHRRELRIRADRADGDKLRHARLPRLVKQVRAHHQVVVEELRRILLVGPDAADARGEVDEHGRPLIAVERLDGGHLHQIVFRRSRRENAGASALAQLVNDIAAEKAVAPGDDHSLLDPLEHRPDSLLRARLYSKPHFSGPRRFA